MKTYRILVACGSGIATSTVIGTRVRELCESHGYKVNVQQVKVTEVEGLAADFDLIVASTRVPASVKTPFVFAINYLTGINKEAVDAQVIEALKKLDEQ